MARSFASALFLFMLCIGGTPSASALVMVGGAEPVSGRNFPAGALETANLPSRHTHMNGPSGGFYRFKYAGKSTADFQRALDAFAAIKTLRLELVVVDGVPEPTGLTTMDKPLHWDFEVWDAEAYASLSKLPTMATSYTGRPYPAPRMTLYLDAANPVVWTEVRVPSTVALLDRRVDASPYKDSKGGVVRATVRDMITGKPATGITLEVGSIEGQSVVKIAAAASDAEGIAVVRDLPAGNHAVFVKGAGYSPRLLGYNRNYGRTLGAFDDAVISPAVKISGRVTDKQGTPLSGVAVGAVNLVAADGTEYANDPAGHDSKVQTDANGRFALSGLPVGSISLSARKPGYYYFSLNRLQISSEPFEIVMAHGGGIHGRITGPPADTFAKGGQFRVVLDPVGDPIGRWHSEKACDANGLFLFEGVPADTYTLRPFVAVPATSGFGYIRSDGDPQFPAREIKLAEGQDLEADFLLAPAP